MHSLAELLSTHPYILADGGNGTMFMNAGLDSGKPSEAWNQSHPEKVGAVHRAFIEAGSRVVLTNSFGGHPVRLRHVGLAEEGFLLNRLAAEIARKEADRAPEPVAVGGSMGPTGELLQPYGPLSPETAREGFALQAEVLTKGGVDVLWLETFTDLGEVQAAIEGARSASNLPLVVTFSFDRNGRTMMGVTPEQAMDVLKDFRPFAVGGNCGNGPHEMEVVIQAMHGHDPNVVLVAKSNTGIPHVHEGTVTFDVTPEAMGAYAVRAYELGARIIGGCCGSHPEHIRAMAEALRNHCA